ncbi:MAG: hypothetical protein K9M10_00355 [Candidatus Pacebacteria bacterium]|nr:hypothetical protein [Candidatus Paceibacterota bacterium]MCF7856913.1 hypothetical protein [Candidatus Paceibacterota bacterium]
MKHTLESHKIFPYIAWTLIVGFAFFTYNLTVQFQSDLAQIGDGVDRLEQRLNDMGTSQPVN